MVAFGVIGLLGNLAGIAVLVGARSASLTMRAAFLEVVNDALGSLAVLVAALVIAVTGWLRADAVASLLIGALIIPRTLKILREAIDVLLESTPRGLELNEVREHLMGVGQVQGVHDLHASQVATGLPVLTAHVVVPDTCGRGGNKEGPVLTEVRTGPSYCWLSRTAPTVGPSEQRDFSSALLLFCSTSLLLGLLYCLDCSTAWTAGTTWSAAREPGRSHTPWQHSPWSR